MDGITVLKNLRMSAWGAEIPVILLTNVNPDDGVITSINAEHPSFYLMKSETHLEDIVLKIREILEI